MSELKPCPCDLILLNDRILNLGAGIATMPEDGTMQVNKVFLTAILGYMEELLGMRRAQPANDPLTLEQLREMDGEPVYIKYHTCGRWEIYQGFMHDHGLYGKTWLAYRRPPERSENDG